MAIGWSQAQRGRVQQILETHPYDSGRCRQAARAILPIGRERDPGARMWRLEPAEGRYVVPRVKLRSPWFFHVTVEAEAHCVDALTGVDGRLRDTYLEECWTEADAIRWDVEKDAGSTEDLDQ